MARLQRIVLSTLLLGLALDKRRLPFNIESDHRLLCELRGDDALELGGIVEEDPAGQAEGREPIRRCRSRRSRCWRSLRRLRIGILTQEHAEAIAARRALSWERRRDGLSLICLEHLLQLLLLDSQQLLHVAGVWHARTRTWHLWPVM